MIRTRWMIDTTKTKNKEITRSDYKKRIYWVLSILDNLVWCLFASSTLSFKLAYDFMHSRQILVAWSNLLWQPSIPPSRSSLLWRFIHCKVATDDILKEKSMVIISLCDHCALCEETIEHLFLLCLQQLWMWLYNIFKCHWDFSSPKSLIISDPQFLSKQVKDVMLFAIIIMIVVVLMTVVTLTVMIIWDILGRDKLDLFRYLIFYLVILWLNKVLICI